MKKLNLNAIRIDGGTQSRVEINNEAVSDYAEAVKVGIEFPPVVVFHDGADHWLADGFHRYWAHKQAGKASIQAEVRAGTVRDAILYSLGANGAHGLRRSNADKRKAVQTLLADAEWAKWPQTKIAEACGVSREFVSRLSSDLSCDRSQDTTRTVERAGKTYQQDTSRIGKRPAAPPEARAATPPAKAPPPAAASAPAPADGGDDFDPITELEAAHAELAKLTEEIKAAEADDLKAEAVKWRRSYEHAQRQQSEAMDRAKQATDREAWTMKQLRRCGKAVGVDDPKKIAAAVEAMARERAAA